MTSTYWEYSEVPEELLGFLEGRAAILERRRQRRPHRSDPVAPHRPTMPPPRGALRPAPLEAAALRRHWAAVSSVFGQGTWGRANRA